MIEFNDVHRRYWRDHGKDPNAAIPVKGGDFIEREGRRYAVLFDCEKAVVAVYQLAGAKLRLIQVAGDEAAKVAAIAQKQRQS